MVLSYCGAIVDTTIMTLGGPPYVGVHTTEDQVVPNLYGEPNIGISVPVSLYGDSLMYLRTQNQQIPSGYMSSNSVIRCGFSLEQLAFVEEFVYNKICSQDLSTVIIEPIEFSVFPNPTSDAINIKLYSSSNKNVEARIYDSHGRMVLKQRVQSEETSIMVSHLNTGNYFVYLAENDGRMTVHQFVKR